MKACLTLGQRLARRGGAASAAIRTKVRSLPWKKEARGLGTALLRQQLVDLLGKLLRDPPS